MGYPNKLAEIAEKRGLTVKELVTQTIEKENGVPEAAVVLTVSPSAVRYQLKKYGLGTVTRHQRITSVVEKPA